MVRWGEAPAKQSNRPWVGANAAAVECFGRSGVMSPAWTVLLPHRVDMTSKHGNLMITRVGYLNGQVPRVGKDSSLEGIAVKNIRRPISTILGCLATLHPKCPAAGL